MKNYYNLYLKLVDTVGKTKDQDLLKSIDMLFGRFEDYVNTIYNMERLLPILKFRYEGQEYRDHVMDLDSSRRSAHEAAMASCRTINRICESVGLEHMFAEYDERSFYTDMLIRLYNDFVSAGVIEKK